MANKGQCRHRFPKHNHQEGYATGVQSKGERKQGLNWKGCQESVVLKLAGLGGKSTGDWSQIPETILARGS